MARSRTGNALDGRPGPGPGVWLVEEKRGARPAQRTSDVVQERAVAASAIATPTPWRSTLRHLHVARGAIEVPTVALSNHAHETAGTPRRASGGALPKVLDRLPRLAESARAR